MIVACPESLCRAENDARNERCSRCDTPLRGYVKLLNHRNHLFNQGLALARSGEFAPARDAFAAIVAWCPTDTEARNALALACFSQRDEPAARQHWQKVLEQSPNDKAAHAGLAALQVSETAPGPRQEQEQALEEAVVPMRVQAQPEPSQEDQENEVSAAPLMNQTVSEPSQEDLAAVPTQEQSEENAITVEHKTRKASSYRRRFSRLLSSFWYAFVSRRNSR